MATDDVRLGRAIYCVANAIEALSAALPQYGPHVHNEVVERELAEARSHLAAVDRGKLAASESPEDTQ